MKTLNNFKTMLTIKALFFVFILLFQLSYSQYKIKSISPTINKQDPVNLKIIETLGEFLETKYPYVVHAEQNAILNARGKSLEGCSIYVNLFPCHECARNIIQ